MKPVERAELPASRDERKAAGKRLRRETPREAHADCRLDASRAPLVVLEAQERLRIPHLVPERRRRMAAAPFAFLRGAAAVMAADLAGQPMAGIPVQASGDCHLLNFGAFLSPEGRLLFDINDFDETLPGVDFTVDLKRLAASIAVAAHDYGIAPGKARGIVAETARAYRKLMRDLADLSPYEIWRKRIDLDVELGDIRDDRLAGHIRAMLTRAEPALIDDDTVPQLDLGLAVPRFQDRDRQIYHDDEAGAAALVAEAARGFDAYPATLAPDRRMLLSRYAHVDTAFKVVGVGSVGTLCAIGLYATPDGHHLVLQIKEARRSVVEPLALTPVDIVDQGQRVVEGQRALQAASDVFLGWMPGGRGQRCFYVRHLKNQRLGSLGALIAEDFHDGAALAAYGDLCARTLARAHARTGDPVMIAGYLGSSDAFDEALADFAHAYALVTIRDHAALVATVG